MRNMKTIKGQKGFTLAELVIVMIVIGIMSPALYSYFAAANAKSEQVYQLNVMSENLTIAQALRAFAGQENNGLLPAPYTGGGYQNAPVDVANATLTEYLSRGNIGSDRFNDDGSTNQNVRYLELLNPKPTYQMPIVGNAAETVALVYDRGVLYQTACGLSDVCNDGTPGTSAAYAAVGWEVTGTDVAPVQISTLDIQQGLWRETWLRLSEVRTKIRNAFNAQVAASAAGDPTNFFFRPDLGTSPDLSGADPATNQGCRDGWYQLNSNDVNVLQFYGLEPVSIYAETSWGGRVEYCPDYDPNDGGVDALPHIGAIRINRQVTTGNAPGGAIAGNLILVI
ncbi:hypothetical protein PULV_a4020 [Pseudoalteromonas ulvae UL12]|nr:hypothetical protein [Pseudoalteromonas ulvae UL12]